MNAHEKKKLVEVLSVQAASGDQFRMFAYLVRQLQDIECHYYLYNGCLYVTKGLADQYPCIVAHMDTVHDIVEDLTVIELRGNLTGMNAVTMEQTGIGGDDKVGIFIALQCLERMDNVKAVFFRDEETGCEGSGDPDVPFFDDCAYVLQCDRRGNGDFISTASGTKLCSKDFIRDLGPILARHGYTEGEGMMTDVMALKQAGISCAMANMSCGYYRPHCADECVNIRDVNTCLSMVLEIMDTVKGTYTCEYKKPKIANTWRGGRYSWMDDKFDRPAWSIYSDDEPKDVVNAEMCGCCSERSAVEYVSEWHMEMCEKCIEQYVSVRSF